MARAHFCHSLLGLPILWLLHGCISWCTQADDSTAMPASGEGSHGAEPAATPRHPTAPTTIEESDVVRADSSFLYVMNKASGLRVIDASQPANPTLAAQAEVLASTHGELYLHRESLLALVEDSGLPCHRLAPTEFAAWPSVAIAQIGNPKTAPEVLVDRCVPGTLATSRLVGDTLYVVTSGGESAPHVGFLFSVDVSLPTGLKVIESLELYGDRVQVHVTDTTIFVAEDTGATTHLRTVDISSGDGSLVERGSYQVPGLAPSRFHLDATRDTFRIVTETPSGDTQLHILDVSNLEQLAELGTLSGIAPGEKLFATRFVGDSAYIVTYQPEVVVNQSTVRPGTDPLWVVSLEDPTVPHVLGRLEIPGWSDYIFPRGDLLVAVGRGQNGQRVATSLFDVHDPLRPTELRRLEFGFMGSTSEASSDFRAVAIIDQALGRPPLVVVPYTDNIARGADCVPEQHLQLVELGERDLTLRGNLRLKGRVLRALPVDNAIYGVTTQELVSLDVTNSDAPAINRTLGIGDPQIEDSCVTPPSAPQRTAPLGINTDGVVGDDQHGCGCALNPRRLGRSPRPGHWISSLWILLGCGAWHRRAGLKRRTQKEQE